MAPTNYSGEVHKAVILAAGRGKRMQQLTADLPKPMLPVAGRPLLAHILERLQAAGISEAFLVTGYRAETIEQHFADYPLPLTFQRQTVLDGTAHAALLAEQWVKNDPFLLTFGDILMSPSDYRGLMDALEPAVEAVVGVKWVDDPYQGAAVYEEQGHVTRIIEKPPQGTSSTHWNSAGLYAFRPSLFAELKAVQPSVRGEYELTSAISQLVDQQKLLRMYAIQGAWRDVGRPEDLIAAEKEIGLTY